MIEDYSITVEKLLKVVHRHTTIVKIKCIGAFEFREQDKVRHDFFLTEDSGKNEKELETQRLLKYYGNVPVWNLHIEHEGVRTEHGYGIRPCLIANCHYSDARAGYLKEKQDVKKAKQKEYRQKKKGAKQ